MPTKVGFDLLKSGNAFAFQITAPGPGEKRFGDEAILYPQRFFHRVTKILLNLTCACHASENNTKSFPGQYTSTSTDASPSQLICF
jgi:hypothetical protein